MGLEDPRYGEQHPYDRGELKVDITVTIDHPLAGSWDFSVKAYFKQKLPPPEFPTMNVWCEPVLDNPAAEAIWELIPMDQRMEMNHQARSRVYAALEGMAS